MALLTNLQNHSSGFAYYVLACHSAVRALHPGLYSCLILDGLLQIHPAVHPSGLYEPKSAPHMASTMSKGSAPASAEAPAPASAMPVAPAQPASSPLASAAAAGTQPVQVPLPAVSFATRQALSTRDPTRT